MSENKHTPEPWEMVFRGDEGDLDIDAFVSNYWGDYVTLALNVGEANAHRIVACVNACAGIETEELEKRGLIGYGTRQGQEAMKQRDAAIAAERVWESSMMQAVGEDGPGDVVKAIEAIKRQRDDIQTKANAMAETINAIAGLCTYQHESKGDFIGRVRAVLGDDPDLRVSSVRKECDVLNAENAALNDYCAKVEKQRDELLAALEKYEYDD